MEDSLKKMVDLGVGLMSFSRDKLSESAKQWAADKKLTPGQTRELIQELVQRGEQGRVEMQQAVQDQVQKTLQRLGIREDQASLQSELSSLRESLATLSLRVQTLEAKLAENEESHVEG